ncbi:hypothetical protein ACLB2K_016132 [Fragaria x ananassa]
MLVKMMSLGNIFRCVHLRLGRQCGWVSIENLLEGEEQPTSLKPTKRLTVRCEVHLGQVYINEFCHHHYRRDWIRQLYISNMEHRCHASSVVMVNRRLFVFGGHIPNEIDDDPSETPVSYFDLVGGDVS